MIVITIEGGMVQEVYNDNPGELVLIRDFDNHDEKGDTPEHSTENTLDLKACDPEVWPDVDLSYYRGLENDIVNQDVELIASGYDWICPVCESENNEPEVTKAVTCLQCNRPFDVAGYSHPEKGGE